MRFVLLGPPGAGKGSVAALIKERLKVFHLSTGEMLRQEIKKSTPLGLEIKGLIEKGCLVSDEIVTKIVKTTVIDDPSIAKSSYMLDGYPRTVQQAKDLDILLSANGMKLDFVINMKADLHLILMRLSGRRICRKCGEIFHTTRKPSRLIGVCDVCGGLLYQRADDDEVIVQKRMNIYAEQTQPIIDYYKAQNKLRILDGNLETIDLFNQFAAMVQ